MPLLRVIPVNVQMNFTSPETRVIVLPDTEDCVIVPSFLWTKHRNVTHRQMDRSAVANTELYIASNVALL